MQLLLPKQYVTPSKLILHMIAVHGLWLPQRHAEVYAALQLMPGERQGLAPVVHRLHSQVRARAWLQQGQTELPQVQQVSQSRVLGLESISLSHILKR